MADALVWRCSGSILDEQVLDEGFLGYNLINCSAIIFTAHQTIWDEFENTIIIMKKLKEEELE